MSCLDCDSDEGFGQFPDPLNPKVGLYYCLTCGEVQ